MILETIFFLAWLVLGIFEDIFISIALVLEVSKTNILLTIGFRNFQSHFYSRLLSEIKKPFLSIVGFTNFRSHFHFDGIGFRNFRNHLLLTIGFRIAKAIFIHDWFQKFPKAFLSTADFFIYNGFRNFENH